MPPAPSTDFTTASIAHLYPWGEIEGWRLLLQHFDLVEGFSLIVVFAPDDWGVALVRTQLGKSLNYLAALHRVPFEPAQGTDSLAESLLKLPELPADVKVLWIDADPAPPDQYEPREQAWRQALAKLNRYRNTLQARLSCTVALAMPSRFQRMFREAAPDLWSIRAGVFRIEPIGGSQAAIAQLPAEERRVFEGDSGDPAETLAEVNKLRGKPGREILLCRLLQRAGNQARQRLDWKIAQGCLEEAYSLHDKVSSGDPELHWEIARDLANVFHDQAKFDRAEHYLRRGLQIAEQHFGPNDPRTAIALNNLATLLQATNRLAEAEPLMRRALAIDEQSYGAEHPNVAIRLNNLAQLLKATNRLAEAEPLMRRALAIDEHSYGAEHPDVAIDLNNLAQLLKATNRLAEAEPLMRRALAIDEQSYGAEHPNVAIRLNNLAALLKETNRLAEAEPLMRRALAIDEQSYGAEHPNVAIRLNNLAQLLQATNRLAEAEPLMRRALIIAQHSLGDDHPNTRTFAGNYQILIAEIGEE